MQVDVIIPVYKPDESFLELIESLEHQSEPIHHIFIMNTEEKYIRKFLYGAGGLEKYRNVTVHNLSKKEFDHGKTRHTGVMKSDAEAFIMMTQDAMPADEHLVENLMDMLALDNVAVAYARQLPREGAGPLEAYTRLFNYPEESRVKTKEDLPELGIKTYFCSNVCAAYRRDVYDFIGGFIRHTIFNEDMIYAASVIKEGYSIAYAADAMVYHSHDYTCKQQFHRNFDLGVSQADHPEVFDDVPSEKEGIKSVKATAAYLRSIKKSSKIPYLYLQSAYKYAGYYLGKRYRKLSRKMILSCTMNKEYWAYDSIKKDASGIDPTKGYGRSENE